MLVPPELAYLGYHVEVEETPAGWVWKAWRRGKHEGAPDLQGGPEKGWQPVGHDSRWLDLVAEVDDEIVGLSCTGPAGFGSGSTVSEYDLYCLYLLPGWERRGLGRAMLERTFSWLRERQVFDLQVLCLRGTTAYLFYEAMGGLLVEEGEHADDDGTVLPHRIYRYDLRDVQ